MTQTTLPTAFLAPDMNSRTHSDLTELAPLPADAVDRRHGLYGHFARGSVTLRKICRNPLNLWLILVLANAIWLPYRGLCHDARLYGFEVLNGIEGGQYHDALSRCYEQSGKFSAFGTIIRPLAHWLGIPGAFFLAYVLSKLFLIYALQRFVTRLIPQTTVAVGSLLLLVCIPIEFGGLGVFHLNESFLTPRLCGEALVLLGLERILQQRWTAGLALQIGALGVHPIMAVPGILVALACLAGQLLRPRQQWAAAILAAVGLVAVLGIRPLGTAIFGEMDAAWMDFVDDFNLYSIPQTWDITDWAALLVAIATVSVAGFVIPAQRGHRYFLAATATVSLCGVLISVLAHALPYARLFQVQPYRWLWLAQLTFIPIGLSVAHDLWRQHRPANILLAFGIASYFLLGNPIGWGQSFVLFGSLFLCARMVTRDLPGGAYGFLALLTLLSVSSIQVLASLRTMLVQAPIINEHVELYFYLRFFTRACGPFLTILLTSLIAIGLYVRTDGQRWFRLLVAALALTVQVAACLLPYSSASRQLGCADAATTQMVDQYLSEHYAATAERPSIYWPGGDSSTIWFRLRAKSYFTPPQLAGTMFLRSSAVEGRRRAELTAPFDIPAHTSHPIPIRAWQERVLQDVFQRPLGVQPPGEGDLRRLCQEPDLDLVVSTAAIGEWYAATNGEVYLYDLRQLRNQLDIHPYPTATPVPAE